MANPAALSPQRLPGAAGRAGALCCSRHRPRVGRGRCCLPRHPVFSGGVFATENISAFYSNILSASTQTKYLTRVILQRGSGLWSRESLRLPAETVDG